MLWRKISSQNLAIETGLSNIINADASIKKLLAEASGRKIFLQAVPLKPIAGARQIELAFEQAKSALRQGSNFSRKPELEFLLRLSGNKQIKNVWKDFGLKKGERPVVIVAAGRDKRKALEGVRAAKKILGLKADNKLLENNVKKNFKFLQSVYAIGGRQLASVPGPKEKALQQLVLEKMALLSLEN